MDDFKEFFFSAFGITIGIGFGIVFVAYVSKILLF
jgi:hypothetical protein